MPTIQVPTLSVNFIVLGSLIKKDQALESQANIYNEVYLGETHTLVVIQNACHSFREGQWLAKTQGEGRKSKIEVTLKEKIMLVLD